jgi:hypothetical protein
VVSYSPRAAKALALLKRHYNDVDIFVEDTGNHNMWLIIARKLLPRSAKIQSVNMLGGRDVVLAACRLDQRDTKRRKLYIIDGDFDFIYGKPKPRLKYLYRLRAYCIENLLISEDAFVQMGLELNPMMDEAQIAGKFDIQGSLREIERELRRLFMTYAVVHKLCPSVQTVGYSVHKLLKAESAGATIDRRKVAIRIIALYRAAISAVGGAAVRSTKAAIAARFAQLPLKLVASGKDYVLPPLWMSFRARCGYRGSLEQLKVALARSFDSRADPYFARRMAML